MQAEIGREVQDMLLAGIAVFPLTGNWGWIRGSKDCKLLSPSLLDYGTILCKGMFLFLSTLWSFWRKDVARCFWPNNFSKWKASGYPGNRMAPLFLDLRESTVHGLFYYFSHVLQSHQGNIARSQLFLLETREVRTKSWAYSNTAVFGHKWKELVYFLVFLRSAPGSELSCRFRHEKRHEVPMCTSGIKSRKLGSVLIMLYWQEMKVLIPITFRAPVPTALRGVTHFGTFEREFASPPSLPHLYCFCSTDLSH